MVPDVFMRWFCTLLAMALLFGVKRSVDEREYGWAAVLVILVLGLIPGAWALKAA